MLNFQIKDIPATKVAMISGDGGYDTFKEDMDSLYGSVPHESSAGPMIALIHDDAGSRYELAMPVNDNYKGEVTELSEAHVVSCLHRGTYESIEDSIDELREFCESQGLLTEWPIREVYTVKNGTSTEIQIPIRRI